MLKNNAHQSFRNREGAIDQAIFDLTTEAQLHPKIWDGETLRENVRNDLLNIGKKFQKYIGFIEDNRLVDIRITGSLTNYSYSDYSDIDVYLIIDFNKFTKDYKSFKKLFRDKKREWLEANKIKIEGYDVEVGVDDIRGPLCGERSFNVKNRSHYSILYNKWLTKPKRLTGPINKKQVYKIVRDITREFRILVESNADRKKFRDLFSRAVKMRRGGMMEEGVWSSRNLAWKVLKRTGVVKEITSFF